MSYLLCVILFIIGATIIYLWCLVYSLNKTFESIVSSNSKIVESSEKVVKETQEYTKQLHKSYVNAILNQHND